MNRAQQCLESIKGCPLTVERRRDKAIELAGLMLLEARTLQSFSDRRRQQQLARMMEDPAGKTFATAMTDQCFRSSDPWRVAGQLIYLIKKFHVPRFLSFFKQCQLTLFKWVGYPLALFAVPLVKRMVRREASAVILPGEHSRLLKHMKKRHQEGVRINLNHIGEAILGEDEANRRLEVYLRDLASPEVECISVKASTIFSQINLLGWHETLDILGDRLKRIYRAAQQNYFVRQDGKKIPKFVYLDMEEFRDLSLTVELFKQVLDDAEFYRYSAGIVLQSYLPDAFLIQQNLTAWAMLRTANRGGPIKIRIVKGANLAMEKVEASMKLWEQAPYLSKHDTDANYKRMLVYGCEPERVRAVHLGVASHNLFDIAYAMILRLEKEIERYVGFEMLEGMADHLRCVVQNLAGDMLLYCPAATQQEFQSAVAYLTRRLDENTAPENFLKHAFGMRPGTKEWHDQADLFSTACLTANEISFSPRRTQNRFDPPIHRDFGAKFSNEPDTDWSLTQNIKWGETILKNWSYRKLDQIPLVIGGHYVDSAVEFGKGCDPSFPEGELYRYALGGMDQLEIVLKTSVEAFKQWSIIPLAERLHLIDRTAYKLKCRRGDLIGAMVADVGKTVSEADVEVSEAIDFASYYRHSVQELHAVKDIQWTAKGPVLVAPPWNFPCSIACGGILAALAAGNTVIFKPAPESVLVGWQLVNILWEAGIDKSVLQFFCCPDDPVGSRLVQDPRLATVILTGATSTAKLFLKLRPDIDLLAETGGKNSMIITSMSDRDLAIKDLVQSAFGYAGQKCSACSLAILEQEVYNDPHFRRQLRDAAASMRVGSPWNASTRINPLIRAPGKELLRGLTCLEEGEEWLLKPIQDSINPQLWSPGIKFGVKPGGFTHQTELFGPVLGVMCANNLQEAIQFANGTPYGLTAGIHSLDEREHIMWKKQIVSGNCYINRTITGAIVRRQPFGGCKESCFGPGGKAGGPNYVLQLMHPKQNGLPRERELSTLPQYELGGNEQELWNASVESYQYHWDHHFSQSHDPSHVLGQTNSFYYVPHSHQILRVYGEDSVFDILRVIAAARICEAYLEISFEKLTDGFLENAWLKKVLPILIVEETDEELAARIALMETKQVRLLLPSTQILQQALNEVGCRVIVASVLANGRFELLHYLREVSLSADDHRYGYCGDVHVSQP
ncbi:MAG: bifunctional proline dehydrogenase/L-glutamate gamma-semialdehyde dehydrogenase [Parachlamydiaceae bacterium]